MALSLFAKLRNKYFQEFIRLWGREPQTPKEWMTIQDNVVRELNKTKGVPTEAKPPWHTGWTPKVVPGGKGIESLLKSGDVKKGVAPKTTKETLKGKKDRHLLLRDSEEDIARIKRENKEAIERFKEKNPKYKTVEDFRDEGDWDPGGMASGGRIAMAGGGALKKFIEQLFIKASNDIRLGRGKWKGLDQKQRIVQHDNLTKKVTEFQKSGKTVGLEEYFGVDPHTAFIGARDKVKRQGIIKKQEELMDEAYEEIRGGSGFTGDYKYDADILADSLATVQGKVYDDLTDLERSGLYDQALKRVQQDMALRREANKHMKDVEQKIELQMFDPKDRKPNASGGRADFIFGGSAGLRALIKRMRGSNKRIMPSGIPTDKRDLVKTLMPREVEQFENLKISQLENLLEALKLDKDQMALRAQNKAMSDPGLDFLMGKLDEMPGSGLTPEGDLAKYADIDQDILILEQMIKNKRMKGRKPHESGGLAYMLGEPTYMKYDGGGSVGHAPWLKPTGLPQPQGQEESPTPQLGGAQSPGRGQPNPMKAPRGLPSVAPRTMDPQYMQQQMMQRMMMGQGQPGQQRMGMEEGGSLRDRLQKDYESLTKGADWMRTAPPKWWLFPEYDPTGHRDDTMTFFKERFMYGDLDPIPTPWQAIKQSPDLVKFKQWLEERKGKADGGRIGLATGEQVYGPPLPEEKIKSPTGEYKTREEIIAEAGIGSGPGVLDFVRPRVDITQTGGPPEEAPSAPYHVDERDITYGGSGLYQGDKAYVGGDYLTGNVKVKVQDEDGNIVFDDTMSKDEFYNLYVGLGKKEGNKVEIGKDTQGTWTLNIVKESNEGDKWDFGVRKAEESEPYVTIKKKWKKKPKILGKYSANQGGRIGMMYGGDPGFQFEYGGSWADWRDQHQHQMPVTDYIKTKLPKERLPFRNSAAGGGIIKALKNLLKKKPKKDVIKPFEFPDAGPQSDFFQKLLDDMLKSESRLKDFDPPKDRKPHEAGGRIGFGGGGMGRRAFLKLMAGIASLPFIGKGVSKVAPKVLPQVTETIVRDSAGIPTYAWDLIEVVKAKGVQQIIEGVTKKVPAKKYSYKGVDVTVHPDGLTEVRKTHTGPGSWTDEAGETFSDDAIHREVGFDIKEGEIIEKVGGKGDDAGKGIKTDDEYFEATVRPDAEGKLKDIEEFMEEVDHLDLKKIADEKETLIIKKASGGRVPLGGGGILKGLKKITKKLKKIKKPEAYIMDKGYKLGKYYKKNPGKGLSHSTAVGTGVLISRHLDRQKRGKKASGGLAHMLGE